MTDAERIAEIARLEAVLVERRAGGGVSRIREGTREMEMKVEATADIERRLATLKAELAGRPTRPRSRPIMF